ncbi:c-type cytochrome [Aliifodinibius halophilus]|uniref:C-type cytochrome n=1 Tax=Fodinibius halophilus TaxID=1736908 RepID=A0A6M1TCM8_9BACT|nr:c-type cytochrome [Fodinibius halophilus]
MIVLSFLFISCQSSDSPYMDEGQQKELQTAYNSLQDNYQMLINNYKSNADSLPTSIQNLYGEMQQMHQQMSTSHRHMMSSHRQGRHMQGERMMGRAMGVHMQNHMNGEWYQQMIEMHRQMSKMHQSMGQPSMSEMNKKLAGNYGQMMKMIPGLDKATDVPFNTQGDPSVLDGQQLFSQNCASCHGGTGEGVGTAFPSVVNSKWITADKTVPIRIVLHGLQGEIEVQGQQYQGVMPSFKARLSAAEITAILNYLRQESDKELPKISQDDVIKVGKKYKDRTEPWAPEDLIQEGALQN